MVLGLLKKNIFLIVFFVLIESKYIFFLFTKRGFSKYGSGRPAQSYICRSVAGLGGSFWTAGTGAECGGAQGRAWVDQLAVKSIKTQVDHLARTNILLVS